MTSLKNNARNRGKLQNKKGQKSLQENWRYQGTCYRKKSLIDWDNHNGVVTHLVPDILESEVKWAQEALLKTKLVKRIEFQLGYLKP